VDRSDVFDVLIEPSLDVCAASVQQVEGACVVILESVTDDVAVKVGRVIPALLNMRRKRGKRRERKRKRGRTRERS
jgi:hypothetical protein